MMRRELLTAALAALILAGAASADKDTGKKKTMKSSAHDACAKACFHCERLCESCATHCAHLLAQGKKEHTRTLATCRDCAKACRDMVKAGGGDHHHEEK